MKKIFGLKAAFIPREDAVDPPKDLPPPKMAILPLVFPLGQLSPLVSEGDKVLVGQCIAEHPDGLLAPINAPVSGVVSEIKNWPTHSGRETPAIFLEAAEKQEAVETSGREDPSELEPAEALDLIKRAGIREPDPYTWPLHVRVVQPQLTPPMLFTFAPSLRKPIETLIINAVDPEPGLYLRHTALARHRDELLAILPVLKRLSLAKNMALALPKGHKLSEGVSNTLERLGCLPVPCPNKYPVGLEPLLVKYITGKEVPQPAYDSRAVGVAVVDILSVLKIYRAIAEGHPVIDTVVQVSTPGDERPMHFRVREGTTMEEALEHFPSGPEKIQKAVLGGPLTGNAQHDLRVPLTQEIQSVILQGKEELNLYTNEPCMNCGYCVRFCPVRLLPNHLSRLCEYGRFQEAGKNDLFSCIECGICAYVCPVRRPMVHLLRFGKHELTAQMEE